MRKSTKSTKSTKRTYSSLAKEVHRHKYVSKRGRERKLQSCIMCCRTEHFEDTTKRVQSDPRVFDPHFVCNYCRVSIRQRSSKWPMMSWPGNLRTFCGACNVEMWTYFTKDVRAMFSEGMRCVSCRAKKNEIPLDWMHSDRFAYYVNSTFRDRVKGDSYRTFSTRNWMWLPYDQQQHHVRSSWQVMAATWLSLHPHVQSFQTRQTTVTPTDHRSDDIQLAFTVTLTNGHTVFIHDTPLEQFQHPDHHEVRMILDQLANYQEDVHVNVLNDIQINGIAHDLRQWMDVSGHALTRAFLSSDLSWNHPTGDGKVTRHECQVNAITDMLHRRIFRIAKMPVNEVTVNILSDELSDIWKDDPRSFLSDKVQKQLRDK